MYTQNTRSIEQDVTRAVVCKMADRAQDGGSRAFGLNARESEDPARWLIPRVSGESACHRASRMKWVTASRIQLALLPDGGQRAAIDLQLNRVQHSAPKDMCLDHVSSTESSFLFLI